MQPDGRPQHQQNYITLLIPILERKLRRTVPTLLSHPALLAHTVYQTLIFDSNMRELGYEFVVSAEAKKTEEKGGVSSVILCQKEWFDAWLEGEKKCKFLFTFVYLSGRLSRLINSC